jgi:hypothetical protein
MPKMETGPNPVTIVDVRNSCYQFKQADNGHRERSTDALTGPAQLMYMIKMHEIMNWREDLGKIDEAAPELAGLLYAEVIISMMHWLEHVSMGVALYGRGEAFLSSLDAYAKDIGAPEALLTPLARRILTDGVADITDEQVESVLSGMTEQQREMWKEAKGGNKG